MKYQTNFKARSELPILYLSDKNHLKVDANKWIQQLRAAEFLTVPKLLQMKTGEKIMLGYLVGPDTPFNLVKIVSNSTISDGYSEAFIEKVNGRYQFIASWACDLETNSKRRIIRKQIYTSGFFSISKKNIITFQSIKDCFAEKQFRLINRFFHFLEHHYFRINYQTKTFRGVWVNEEGMTEDNFQVPASYTRTVLNWIENFDFETKWTIELPTSTIRVV